MELNANSGKSVLYVAVSLDGYLAGENDDLSFLSLVETPGEDYGYAEFMKSIDASIMGRKTIDWVLDHDPDFLKKGHLTYAITHRELPESLINNNQSIIPYNGDVPGLVRELLNKGKNLFIVGGSEIIFPLMLSNLIDEFHIAFIPILLGKGTLLFKPGFPQTVLNLVDVKKYKTGLVMLKYAREQNNGSLVDARENN